MPEMLATVGARDSARTSDAVSTVDARQADSLDSLSSDEARHAKLVQISRATTTCAVCRKTAVQLGIDRLGKCGGCGLQYCTRDEQRADWPRHKCAQTLHRMTLTIGRAFCKKVSKEQAFIKANTASSALYSAAAQTALGDVGELHRPALLRALIFALRLHLEPDAGERHFVRIIFAFDPSGQTLGERVKPVELTVEAMDDAQDPGITPSDRVAARISMQIHMPPVPVIVDGELKILDHDLGKALVFPMTRWMLRHVEACKLLAQSLDDVLAVFQRDVADPDPARFMLSAKHSSDALRLMVAPFPVTPNITIICDLAAIAELQKGWRPTTPELEQLFRAYSPSLDGLAADGYEDAAAIIATYHELRESGRGYRIDAADE